MNNKTILIVIIIAALAIGGFFCDSVYIDNASGTYPYRYYNECSTRNTQSWYCFDSYSNYS